MYSVQLPGMPKKISTEKISIQYYVDKHFKMDDF